MNIRVVIVDLDGRGKFRGSIQALFIDSKTMLRLFSVIVRAKGPVTLEIAKYRIEIDDLEGYKGIIDLAGDMANALHNIGAKSMSEIFITLYLEAGNHQQFGWEFE